MNNEDHESYVAGILMLARVIVGMIELDNIRKQDIYQFCKDIITINEKGEDK